MKKAILTAMVMAMVMNLNAMTIPMGNITGQLDTIDSWQAGPGTIYTHYLCTYGSRVRHIFMMEVDLSNPNITLETVMSKNGIGTYEQLTSMYSRLDQNGHRMIGGINTNFWCVGQTIDAAPNEYSGQLGIPLQGCVSNSMIGTDVTGWDRVNASVAPDKADYDIGHLVLTADKKAIVRDMRSTATVTIHENSLGIRDINRPRTYTQEDRLTLYNKIVGTTPRGLCGKEIVFEAVNGWTISKDMKCVVRSINTTGGTALNNNMGALQGFNGGCNILNLAQVGDTITLNITIAERASNQALDVKQMVAGNALVMMDGALTNRNYNEAYNSQDYPRPVLGTNAAGNKVWLMECQGSAGMSTADACYVLKALGATEAGSYDGGGSAQMCILGKMEMPSSDNRPLPLGLWVVATSQDNPNVGKMEFREPLHAIPAYAGYTPVIRAWNEEGILLSHDYQDFTLSCEPATMGTISVDGKTFTANPVNESGKLIAHAGTCTAEIDVEIKDGEVRIVLDSVVLGNSDYNVEVIAVAGTHTLPIAAKALSWSTADATICTVNEGVLHGEKNGRTEVIGTLAGFADTLKVNVELADAPQLRPNGDKVAGDWAGKTDSTFQLTNTRTGSVEMPINVRTYGCPDSVLIVINSDAPVAAISLSYQANGQAESSHKVSGAVTPGEDYTYRFALDKLVDKTEQSIYPVWLKNGKFTFKDPKAKKNYTINIKDVIFCYHDWKEASGLWEMHDAQGTIYDGQKIMVGGQLYIIRDNRVYNVMGKEL